MGFISRQTQEVLTDEALRRVAPSIFAQEPWEGMSSRYAFLPTINIVNQMRQEGLQPFYAVQAECRMPGKAPFTKHLIRFRDTRQGIRPATEELGGLFPEAVMVNSHDGASTYQIDCGIWRQICINGLRTGECFQHLRVRHTGSPAGIIDATFKIVDEFPRVIEQALEFGQIQLAAPEQKLFAEKALAIRYDDPEKAPVKPEHVIRVQRREDAAPTLFNVFNRAQETLVEGRTRRWGNDGAGHAGKVRAIRGIDQSTKVNQGLWDLAADFAALKGIDADALRDFIAQRGKGVIN